MKRYVSIIALLLTAALLTACGSGADTQSKEADAAVQTALPPEGITALVLSDDSQVLRFSREDETWYWQDDTTFPLDQEAMPALVEAAAAMTAASPVRVAEEDLADYGLDDTKITLAVTAGGETLTFARGDQAESGDWYMRCAEDGTVRLVSDNAVKIFQLLDGSIYDMAALPVLPVITEENLLSAAVQGGENVLVNIRVVDGVRKVGSRDVTEATAALVEELGRLSVTACVDYVRAGCAGRSGAGDLYQRAGHRVHPDADCGSARWQRRPLRHRQRRSHHLPHGGDVAGAVADAGGDRPELKRSRDTPMRQHGGILSAAFQPNRRRQDRVPSHAEPALQNAPFCGINQGEKRRAACAYSDCGG